MGAPCPLNLYRPKDNPLLHATNRRPGYTGAAVPIMPKRQCCPEQMHRETMRRLKDAAAGPPLPTRKYLVLWRIKSMLKCLTLKCCHSADGYGFWQNLRPSDRWNISSFPTPACSIIKVLGGGGVGEETLLQKGPSPTRHFSLPKSALKRYCSRRRTRSVSGAAPPACSYHRSHCRSARSG